MSEMHFDVIVIGGGPAGSTAATIAARSGLSVLLLESGSHPRPHVGESMLPGIIPILAEMGVLEAVEAAGFGPKSGATQWNWGLTPRWDLWFRDTDSYDHAWLLDRSEFDTILFQGARAAGAEVRENSVVRSLVWEGERLTGVRFLTRGGIEQETATAALVVDASGPAALVARERGGREMIEGLKHQAAWAHFEGAAHLPPPREHQALFIAARDHWTWLFPIGKGRTSIGIVWLEGAEAIDYDRAVMSDAAVVSVIGERARRVTPVRRERDWSYRVARVTGPGFMLAGDASGFIDPILSTGVFLAMHAGWHAARTARAILREGLEESKALEAYSAHHRRLFEDMLRMVRFYYQQNLHMEDYFWESKRILMRPETELRPQRSFMILTSGLVQNIPFGEAKRDVERRRETVATGGGEEIDRDPKHLSFVCLHLEHRVEERPIPLYFLIEPRDATSPALFRTQNWDLSCLAPRYGNAPINVPSVAPYLHAIAECVRRHDSVAGESLADFWRRARGDLADLTGALPAEFAVIRTFGE